MQTHTEEQLASMVICVNCGNPEKDHYIDPPDCDWCPPGKQGHGGSFQRPRTTFIVTTWEHVEGRYRVEADSAEEAQAKFGNPKIDWEKVEQLDYQAFEVDVRSVEGPFWP